MQTRVGARGRGNINYNGGLAASEGRTVIVHRDGKRWTFYYRALIEAHIGRALRSDEVVHHINGDSSDDRIENLQVLSRAEHLALHRSEVLGARAARTHCRRGHELTPENIYGIRSCRTCRRERGRAWEARRAAQETAS